MSWIERPVSFLIAAPTIDHQSTSQHAPDRILVEALITAIERQGEAAGFTWLWPATLDTLQTHLAEGATPTIDILAWDGPSETLAQWLGEVRPSVVLLWRDLVEPLDAEQVELLASAGVLQLDRRMMPDAQIVALSSFVSSLVGGLTPAQAQVQAVSELASRTLRARLSAGGATLDPAQCLLWQSTASAANHKETPVRTLKLDEASGVERVVAFPSPSLAPGWQTLPVEPLPGGLPVEPDHGFVGRNAELHKIETALRELEGPLWLHGHLGVGKTVLALHAARWMVRTGAIRRVVYTNWSGGGMAEETLYALGRNLVGRQWDPRDGSALSQIDRALAETPTLIIWDQIDALLPEGILPLASEDRQALWELADHLQTAGARLVLIADTLEPPNETRAMTKSPALVLAVHPLESSDAVDVWDTLHGDGEPDAKATRALVHGLGEHPLGLALVAAAYPQQTAAQVSQEIATIMPGFAVGEARLSNQALDLGIECLMRALGDDVRALLTRLGFYTQGFMQALALRLMGIEAEVWAPIQERLASAQLLTALRMPGFNVPYVRLHPALERYLSQRMAGSARVEWQPIYTGGYLSLLVWLLQSESRSPEHVLFLTHCEMGNLRKSLRLLLADQHLRQATELLRGLTHFCEILGYASEQRQLVQQFERATQAAIPNEGPLGRPGVQFMLQRCDELLAQRQVPQAGALLQQLTERMNAEGGLSYSGDHVALDKAMVTHRMGRAVMAMGRPDAALASMQQALSQLPTPSSDTTVLATRLEITQELTQLLRTGGAAEPALQLCQQGLELAQQLQDDTALGNLYSEQGILLTIQSDLPAARQAHESALFHYQRTGDQTRVARVWEGLSQVAWQENDLENAQACLDRALEALPKDHSPTHEGHLHTLMAQIAEMDGRVHDAERFYGAAIRIYQDHRIVPEMVNTEMALARLLLAHGRHQEAHIQAEAARASAEKLGPQAVPWEIYELLRDVAVAEEDEDAAARWRVRAQQVFGASPAADNVRQQWRGLIISVSNSCRGEALDMTVVETVEKLEATPQWQQLAQAVWRVLGGEHDPDAYQDLDPVDAVVVLAMLDAIEHPLEDEAPDGEPDIE